MICFDNVSRVVGGDMLESYLTANGKFTERILGVSEEISVDADCLLTFSGNGLKCKPDFARLCPQDAAVQAGSTRCTAGVAK